MILQSEILNIVQASDYLNVSQGYLANLLDNEEIPFRGIGNNRCILLRDAKTYKSQIDQKRLGALQELSDLSQEIGME